MTLQEKFKLINCNNCDMPYCEIKCTILAPSELIKLEQIAEEFAIGFAEWVECSKTYYTPMKELLEMYKKEKGL